MPRTNERGFSETGGLGQLPSRETQRVNRRARRETFVRRRMNQPAHYWRHLLLQQDAHELLASSPTTNTVLSTTKGNQCPQKYDPRVVRRLR